MCGRRRSVPEDGVILRAVIYTGRLVGKPSLFNRSNYRANDRPRSYRTLRGGSDYGQVPGSKLPGYDHSVPPDKDIGTQSTAPRLFGTTPTRDTRHADTPKHRYAENVPVPATVDPRSGMKVCCAKTCFSATRKVLNKNFSSRNSRKTGLAQAQKIAWHNGCLRGFTSSD